MNGYEAAHEIPTAGEMAIQRAASGLCIDCGKKITPEQVKQTVHDFWDPLCPGCVEKRRVPR